MKSFKEYMHDYGTDASVKYMKSKTPGQKQELSMPLLAKPAKKKTSPIADFQKMKDAMRDKKYGKVQKTSRR